MSTTSLYLLFLLYLAILVLLTRPLTTLLHELGHAIPALLLTRSKVTAYIGTYGDPQKSIRVRMGRLELYFRYNPFSWRMGICMVAAEEVSYNRQILYILTGPLASFIIAVIAAYCSFAYDLHGFIKLFL